MTIRAEKVGRDLHITVEGVDDPFVIHPLPGLAGVQITETYLQATVQQGGAIDLVQALQMAVDGARENPDTGRWEPLPADEQTTYRRIGRELSQDEGEHVMMPAFLWQTVLGIDGVTAYIEAGEGLAGTLKATRALTARMGLLTPRTSPSSE